MHTPTPTPIKYVPKKINGTLMWAPVYKKGESPSVPTTNPAQPVSKKVGTEKTVPPGFLKRYREERRGVKKGILTSATCRICDKPFKYKKSESSRPRNLCGVVCAYQAQKNYTKEYEARKKAAPATKDTQPKVDKSQVVQGAEKTTICKGCGKSFQWKQTGRHAPRKFCEARCRLGYWDKQQSAARSRVDDAKEAKKSFVKRVAEHLPPPVLPKEKETTSLASSVQPPSWEALTEEASAMGVVLEKEPPRGQSFYIALLMARRAKNHEEWRRLLKTQDVRIRQFPETYAALKSVSGNGAVAAARALKTRMGM